MGESLLLFILQLDIDFQAVLQDEVLVCNMYIYQHYQLYVRDLVNRELL